MADARLVTATIDGANQFTDSIRLSGAFDLSISGIFTATVTVQRSYDNSTWRDVDTFTSPTEETGFQGEIAYYRAGVKTGEFTSGPVSVSLAGSAGIDYTPQR
jgi:hypothetical protein